MNDEGVSTVFGTILMIGVVAMMLPTIYMGMFYIVDAFEDMTERLVNKINSIDIEIDYLTNKTGDDNSTGGIVPPPPVINNDSTITITVVAIDKEGIPYFVTWTQPYLVAVEVDP